MNIHQGLEENLSYISVSNAACFNIEEIYKLTISLDDLHVDLKSDEMSLWGKIMGAEKDYYIAEALFFKGQQNFPKKKFYFCSSSNFVFSELPEIQEHQLRDMGKFNTYFIGNPDIILEKYDTTSKDERMHNMEEEIGDIFKPKMKLKNLTESDRLSYVVRTIDFETSVIPEGGVKMLPINEMRRNDIFTGLNSNELTDLSKFLHFRPARNQNKKDLIAMGKAIFDYCFLDSLSEDPIKDCWSVQTDSTKTIATIRSLIWPGYFAYHKANSQIFGGIYIGYGIKNLDIPFMQQ